MHQTIHLHPLAPAKPELGKPCNGCGVCCAAEPCPTGVIVSRRRHGRCAALIWDEDTRRYWCGMVSEPQRFLWIKWPWLNRRISRWVRQRIAADVACDSDSSEVYD